MNNKKLTKKDDPRANNGFRLHPENINRKGPPKKEWTWGSLFREKAEELGDDKREVKHAVAEAILEKAKQGDVQAFNVIADRTDGKAIQKNENENKNIYTLSDDDKEILKMLFTKKDDKLSEQIDKGTVVEIQNDSEAGQCVENGD